MFDVKQEMAALFKSPGGWFFFSNAVLYTQTDPLIALFYFCALVYQRVAHHAAKDKVSGHLSELIAGPQGLLAVNAMMTLASALTTIVLGRFELAISGLMFGLANLTQSIVYARSLAESFQKHFVLVLCEFSIAVGLAMIATNAGYSISVSFGLIVPVLVAGAVRCFRAHWLPSGFAYLDMMFLTVMTFCEALVTSNAENAVSRILVFFGLTRLAVLRARSEGKTSFFEIERYMRGKK